MNSLKFNDKFDSILEEPTSYWKTIDDIPQNIKDFINKTSDSIPFYTEDNNTYYCPLHIEKLIKENKCPICHKKFTTKDKLKNLGAYIYYYVFDINDNNILLYLLCEDIEYLNVPSSYSSKQNKISIKTIYQILPTKIININENKHITYKELEETITRFKNTTKEINDKDFELLDEYKFNTFEHQYLYTDNLEDLKNTTLYKYSNIWTLKNYLNYNYFTLSSITFYPAYYKEFEYLLKLKLYNLAITSSSDIKYKGSFKSTFGVPKKYYEFMKDIDIDYLQLEALKLYPTTNITMLNFIKNNLSLIELILKYTNLDKVLNYLKEQNLTLNNLHEYGDYIRCSKEMKLNLKDHSILFPKNFIKSHDKITIEMIISKDPLTNKRIKNLSNILILNKYEDDKYIIFPANSINSLIDESSQQSNCVRTYCDMVSNNECQIYFMRYKSNINKSFITIEVRNNKVVQAKTRFNEDVPEEIMNIIMKWEKTLIPLINE